MANKPTTDKVAAAATLQRGKACLRCRKRKMKCDGSKPACQQCVRAKKGDGCEYDDGKGKTRTQLLKETIAKLESRVRQLEDPSNIIPTSVMLFDPHDLTVYSGSSPDSFEDSPDSSYLSAFPTASESSASPSTPWSQLQGAASPLAPPSMQDIFFDERHSPFQASNDVSVMLLDIFAPHARQCGLEMDMEVLRQSVALPITEQRHSTFLNAIYLWACFISRPEALSQNESHYLRLSLEAMPDALHKGKYIDAIRASCLVSLYFLSTGRFPEGAYHASAAAALADQLGLGKQAENLEMLDIKSFKTDAYEADRLLAFWQVYNLDRCWSVVLEKEPVIVDSGQPSQDDHCPVATGNRRVQDVNSVSQGPTIQAFLAGSISANGFSTAALRVKASALLSQVDRLTADWYPGMKISAQMVEDVNKLEHAVALFQSTLMPIDQLDKILSEEKHSSIVAHTIAQTAIIFLHRSFAAENPISAEKCAQASRLCVAMIKHIGEKEFSFLDPIVGPCWSWVTDCAVSRLDALERTWPLSGTSEVIGELASLMYAMNQLSIHFPLVAPALSRVQDRLA
ncbi:hypothetical protein DFP72DRAFT_1062206 [Ephemerocybe angulata]|uniref:Zn(2)-C6 fungal-type domain-containing protein n=1 Tax=Ephemerocybe angulata TaxID=980116 RepID=A0A8H6MCW1_9AGAR|nr:hypothetical protein DFP72DRAFT_1062206 [Tulosesus angulatus]